MNLWHAVGRLLAPLKHSVFWLLARVHKTTRPRVAFICGNEVLLVQNWGDTNWALPGGGMHRHESIQEAARREIHEELGITVSIDQLEYIDTIELANYIAPLFVVRVIKKPLIRRQSIEIHDAKWFSKTAVPADVDLLATLKF